MLNDNVLQASSRPAVCRLAGWVRVRVVVCVRVCVCVCVCVCVWVGGCVVSGKREKEACVHGAETHPGCCADS